MPKMQEIRQAFKGIGLTGAYVIRWLDYKHILIHLSNEQDFNRIWTKQQWFIANQKMRVFKWSPDFEAEKESPIVPVWISFPNLKAHLYEKSALLLIAKTVGKPLFIDEATSNASRPSVARVCVEYNCRNAPVEEIWIVIKDRVTGTVTGGYAQKVEFSKMPDYCEHCGHVGHSVSTCLVLGNRSENLRKEKLSNVHSKSLAGKKQTENDDKGLDSKPMDDLKRNKETDRKISEERPMMTGRNTEATAEKRNKILNREVLAKHSLQWQAVGHLGQPKFNGFKGAERHLEDEGTKQFQNVNRFSALGSVQDTENEEQIREGKQILMGESSGKDKQGKDGIDLIFKSEGHQKLNGEVLNASGNHQAAVEKDATFNVTKSAGEEVLPKVPHVHGARGMAGKSLDILEETVPETRVSRDSTKEFIEESGQELHQERVNKENRGISFDNAENSSNQLHGAMEKANNAVLHGDIQLQRERGGPQMEKDETEKFTAMTDTELLPPAAGSIAAIGMSAHESVQVGAGAKIKGVSLELSNRAPSFLHRGRHHCSEIAQEDLNMSEGGTSQTRQVINDEREKIFSAGEATSISAVASSRGPADGRLEVSSATKQVFVDNMLFTGNHGNTQRSFENVQKITVRKHQLKKKAKPVLASLVPVMDVNNDEVFLKESEPNETHQGAGQEQYWSPAKASIAAEKNSEEQLNNPQSEPGNCALNMETDSIPSNTILYCNPEQEKSRADHEFFSMQPHAEQESDNLIFHPRNLRRRKSDSSLYSHDNWNSLNASEPAKFTLPWLSHPIFSSFVYAKCTRQERIELWNFLRSVSWDMYGPWMVGGDFNSILSSAERLHGANPHNGSMEDFATMLLDCGLHDAGYEGNNFTWTNNHMFQRLDRVVYNHEWADCFNHTRVQHLNRDGSDHCPLLISCENTAQRGPSNFRFLHAWTHHHDFTPFVERSWRVPIQATGMLAFWQKQQRLKRDLKWWNKQIFGDIFHNLKLAEAEAATRELHFQQDPSLINRNLMHKAYAKLNLQLDDIVIFTNGCRSSLQKILNFLQEYEQVSGQQVNHQKSCFITTNGCALSRRQIISHTTGFHHKTLPVTYLGAPLHKGQKKVILFDSLISKIRDRISGWENKILSPGGRITLLRSVLSSQPMYLLQVLKPPVTVIEKIERLFNSFLWGDSCDGKKLHWTAWSKITFPVSEGGLDIRNLRDVFEAFSLKLWWRFQTCNSLWTRFLRTKYCLGRIPHLVQPKLHDSQVWKRMIVGRDVALQNIRWRIGKGELFFWHDCWMGDQPLATLFPSFHNDMSHVHKFYNGDEWDIVKLNSYLPTSLVDEILQIPFDRSQEDVAYWALTSNGEFSFWSAWEIIRQRQTPNALLSFNWHRSIPLSISFFLWRVLNNWIPVELRMKDKGIHLASKCVCCRSEESLIHVLWENPVAKQVWNFFAKSFQIYVSKPKHISQIIWAWFFSGDYTRNGHIRILIPLFICWFLWLERNDAKHRHMGMYPNRVIWRIMKLLNQLHAGSLLKQWQWKGDTDIATMWGFKYPPKYCQSPQIISWIKPFIGEYKLNVDGSSKSSQNAAGGGVLRDHTGKLAFAFSENLGPLPSLQAELHALLRGLLLCKERNITNLWIEMDALVAVQMVQQSQKGSHDIRYLLESIRLCLRSFSYRISHIYREGNQAADFLSNKGQTHQSLCVVSEAQEFPSLPTMHGLPSGRPPDPNQAWPATHQLQQSTATHQQPSTAPLPQPHSCQQVNGSQIQRPSSPRSQKKSFLSIITGEKPSVVPLTRDPFVFKDRPAAAFFEDEIQTLAKPFKLSLVGKFSRMPKLQDVRAAFKGIGLAGAYEVRWLDYKHVLIHLSNEQDFNRIWTKQNWFIATQKMRVFKWTPEFEPEKESAVVPVWISFPNLKAHLFEKSALLLIAKTVGKPLFVDEATANGSRPSVARVCVEFDCRQPPLDQVWIVVQNRKTGEITNGYSQRVEFAQMPAYCDHCCHVGHKETDCILLGNKARPPGITKQPNSRLEDGGRRVGSKEDGEFTTEKRKNIENSKKPQNDKILYPEEPPKHQKRGQPANKGSTSGTKIWQGKKVQSDKASKDENISVSNRFHIISEEEEDEHSRTAQNGKEKKEKNKEKDEGGKTEGIRRGTTEERTTGAEIQTGSGKPEGAEMTATPSALSQILEDNTQGTLHEYGVHGQLQKLVEERDRHAEKESENPRIQNNKIIIKSQQKDNAEQHIRVRLQKEETQKKSTARTAGPSLQAADMLRPAKTISGEPTDLPTQAAPTLHGVTQLETDTEDQIISVETLKQATTGHPENTAKQNNKAKAEGGKMITIAPTKLHSERNDAHVRDQEKTHPSENHESAREFVGATVEGEDPAAIGSTPHHNPQVHVERNKDVGGQEPSMHATPEETLLQKACQTNLRQSFLNNIIESSTQVMALRQDQGHYMTEHRPEVSYSLVDTREGSGEHVPIEEEGKRKEDNDLISPNMESASSKCLFNKEPSDIPSFSGNSQAEVEVHPRERRRRHSDTAIPLRNSLSSATEEAIVLGGNDEDSDGDSISRMEFNCEVLLDHPQCLHVRLTIPWLDFPIFTTFVYAKCTRSERTPLWDSLRGLAADMEGPWLVGGDFNVILKREERLYGADPHEGSMEDFASALLDCGLLDGGFEGNPFTWTNNRMFQRLDRMVFNHQWINKFPITRIQHLNRDGSDHCPLLLSCSNSSEKAPSSFRFLHAWTLHHNFNMSVEEPNLQEVKEVVFGMDPESAAGPDGFSSHFYQQCWDIIAYDLFDAVKDFFQGADIPQGVTSTTGLNALYDQYPSLHYSSGCSMPISHLAFADDVIIFANGSKSALQRILAFLQEYEELSGQRINPQKSCVVTHTNMASSRRQIILQATGFSHRPLPITYLGAPLFKGHKKVILFNDLVAKIEERITGWENKILSPGGRITLLRSTLSSLPIYLLQVLKPPIIVLERINRLFNNFLWGGSASSKRIHWASWGKIALPIAEGGLDIRNLEDVFKAFSMKLWWRFRTTNSLWMQFMRAKYCGGQLPTHVQPKLHDSQTWKRMVTISSITEQNIRWRVGHGKLFFWHDCWMGEEPLVIRNQEFASSMAQVSDFFLNNSWDIEKLKSVLQQEVVEEIAKIPINASSNDRAYWTPTPNGDFSTKSAWQLSRERKVVNPTYNYIWHKSVPLTTSFFLWRLLHDWVPVELKMKSKGFQLASRCRCCKSEESLMHVMWDNPVANQVWSYFAKVFQIHIINPCTINHIISAWFYSGDYSKPGHIRTLVPLFILWFLWVERNDAKHRNLGMYPNRIVWKILKLIHQLFQGKQLQKWQWQGDKQIAQEWGIILKAVAPSPPKLLFWNKPSIGEFKLNVDGSSKYNLQTAAGGGLLRDHTGSMIFGFSENFGSQDSLQAELMALHRGLLLCIDHNVTRLWIEMDAKVAVQMINEGHQGSSRTRYLLASIHRCLSGISFRISHIFREGNQAADHLSNQGYTHQNLQVISQAEGQLRGILRLDKINLAYVRFK
ncbi:Uncharacterized protein TCM_021522 [Theobroma cacao]|uniref:RNase H type-1 domain-containing protein n=1 Tax=Theobroma cacao TaxID=3641 RepID=A0A061EPI0_THECC|nr:Uncharacterized protein TCM_021522 [Theobroma cacao]